MHKNSRFLVLGVALIAILAACSSCGASPSAAAPSAARRRRAPSAEASAPAAGTTIALAESVARPDPRRRRGHDPLPVHAGRGRHADLLRRCADELAGLLAARHVDRRDRPRRGQARRRSIGPTAASRSSTARGRSTTSPRTRPPVTPTARASGRSLVRRRRRRRRRSAARNRHPLADGALPVGRRQPARSTQASDLGPVLEDLAGGELARRAHDAAARVGAGAALVVAVDRRPVLRPARRRPEEEHLRGEELAGEDVALADGPRSARCAAASRPRAGGRGRRSPGRTTRASLDGVAQVLLLGVPVALAQLVRRVLDEARHDVLAGRRHVGVDRRLDGHVDVRAAGCTSRTWRRRRRARGSPSTGRCW